MWSHLTIFTGCSYIKPVFCSDILKPPSDIFKTYLPMISEKIEIWSHLTFFGGFPIANRFSVKKLLNPGFVKSLKNFILSSWDKKKN